MGGGYFAVMSGPCSVESKEQITYVAQRVQAAGASILRGGAFKPRTSPYSFQGLRAEGLELLQEARKVTGQPIVTELMNNEHIPLFLDAKVDMIQIGARNMQNFELLKAVGKLNVPVLLKRGLSSTLEELVMSAEYIMAEGNPNVVLCERGIRTFETSMRNTLDISAVPMLKKMTHLPVVIDPSHAAGIAFMVPDLAKAAVAVGADGLMIETHNDPAKAKSDGAQSLTPDQFDDLMSIIKPELEFFGKETELSLPPRGEPLRADASIGLYNKTKIAAVLSRAAAIFYRLYNFFRCWWAAILIYTGRGRKRPSVMPAATSGLGTMTVLRRAMPSSAQRTQYSGVMPRSANSTLATALNSVSTGPGQRQPAYTGLWASRNSWAKALVRLTT